MERIIIGHVYTKHSFIHFFNTNKGFSIWCPRISWWIVGGLYQSYLPSTDRSKLKNAQSATN